jgi:hypothetical protein
VTREPLGRGFCSLEALSVGADFSAVYCEGSRWDQSGAATHRGNCDSMLDLHRGGYLFQHHAICFRPDWPVAREQCEAQTHYLLRFETRLPDV